MVSRCGPEPRQAREDTRNNQWKIKKPPGLKKWLAVGATKEKTYDVCYAIHKTMSRGIIVSIKRSKRPEKNFSIISNDIITDKNLTWEARGLLIYILSKPDDWRVMIADLINQTENTRKQSKRDSVRAILGELQDTGYMRKELCRNEAGAITGYDYFVYESPQPDLPATDLPATANPPLLSTEDSINTEELLKPLVSSCDDTRGKNKKNKYSEEFERAWAEYPRRLGGNPKRTAYKSWCARIKNGATVDQMIEGVIRYRKFVEATGKSGSQFVMQAATFFGPDERFLESWGTSAPSRRGLQAPKDVGQYTPQSVDNLPEWMK